MFIVGLLVGPAIGLLVGDALGRWAGAVWRGVVAAALLFLFVVLAPVFSLELKIGLMGGMLLGLLLQFTPEALDSPADAV